MSTQFYLKEDTNSVYANPSDSLINSLGLIPITAEEADAILNPPPTFAEEYSDLANKYKANIKSISESFSTAGLWGVNVTAKQNAITQEAINLRTQFAIDLSALKTKHEV